MDIIQAINNKDLFKPLFRDLSSWWGWTVLLKAFFGIPLTKRKEKRLFRECTGGRKLPKGEFKELWAVIGRRGGKSFISAVTAVFLALFFNYKKYLSPGELGSIQVIAADRSQAQVILNYIKGILHSSPVFEQYISRELRESVELTNRIVIEVMTASYRRVRGRTLVCAIFDEVAFWMVEGTSPDKEILGAVRPSMATIPNSKLIVISSPYARHGILHEHYRDYFGKNDPEILCWQAPTRVMNPTIPQSLIDREKLKDPSAARAEWYAEFRQDIEEFLSLEAIEECCTLRGRLAPDRRYRYKAFVDPSGGRADAMTLCIGHLEKDEQIVVDHLAGWKPPFDPGTVVVEIINILGEYGIKSITGDRYGAAWVSTSFTNRYIRYENSEKVKSDLYLNLEGIVNTGKIQLPDRKLLKNQLMSLERRRGKSGRDVVDHPPRGNDDYANAVAGIAYLLGGKRQFGTRMVPITGI